VEFALVGITFFILLIGIFEVGRLIYGLGGMTNAAREGARYAVASGNPAVTSPRTVSGTTYPGTACGSSAALTRAATVASQGIPVVVTAVENPTNTTMRVVSCTVTVTWNYTPASGFFSILKPHPFTSSATLYFYSDLN
jgi:Flp pilus assembly protein TadG